MGSSFTDFRGQGFWSRDRKLELWLQMLSEQVLLLDEPPSWLRLAQAHWLEQATIGFQGVVNADLDRLVGDDDSRVAVLRELADHALRRLEPEVALSTAELNSDGAGGGGHWTADIDSSLIEPVARAFGALLAGTLDTNSRTSPVL